MKPAPPRILETADLEKLIATHNMGALATNKRNGHPHLSTVAYHWDAAEKILRISTTADRLKVKQIRNDARVALHVSSQDMWSFAVAEGIAELSEVATEPGDAATRELLALAPQATPELLIAERRLIIRIRVNRLYGTALDVT